MKQPLVPYAPLFPVAILLTIVIAVGDAVLPKRWLWPEYADSVMTFQAVVASESADKPKTIAVDLLMADSHRKLKAYIIRDERSTKLKVGDGILVHAKVENAGQRYLEVQGYSGRCLVRSNAWHYYPVDAGRLSTVERSRLWFLIQRHRLLKRFNLYGNDERYGVLAAITLGEKSSLARNIKDVYSATGVSHVLALSGLHLGIIYALLSFFIPGRRWRVAGQSLLVLSIWAFAFLTGLSPSVIRSATMISGYALLSLANRDRMSLNMLSLTAIIMLTANPTSLFDVGFQLSFMAVLAILVFLPLFNTLGAARWMCRTVAGSWIWGVVSVSFAAQLGVAPLLAFYFGRISTWFFLSNILVVPVVTVLLYGGFAALLLPAEPVMKCLYWLAGGLNEAVSWLSQLPFAQIETTHTAVWQVCVAYILEFCLWLWLVRRANMPWHHR